MEFAEKQNLSLYLADTHISLLPYLERSTREIVSPFLCKCFSGSKKIVIFDLETNGIIKGISSILSISAKKYELTSECKLVEIDTFDRYYYFNREPENEKTTAVNGLTRDNITKLRESADYPLLASEDNAFREFCSDVDSFIAYNISFDISWFPWMQSQNTLCAMLSSVGLILETNKYGGIKSSKLITALNHLNIDISDLSFHKSLDDVEATKRLIQYLIDIS